MKNMERKPISRSKIRLYMGAKYYTLIKYFDWYFSNEKYAKIMDYCPYPCVVVTHSTPLLRKLKDVEMYLQHNKIVNLKLAINKLNGVIIRPGETFSYWKLIGKPTYKKGYLDGLVLCPNGTFKPGVGGGLCQLSNLIYWMVLHTPLTVTERYRHSHDAFPDINRTQPFGTGATCSYNYLDLQIKNLTGMGFQLLVSVTKENLVGEFRTLVPNKYSYEVYEKEHSITPGLFGGYIRNNLIFRKIYNINGEIVSDEYITENHAYMTYAPYLDCGKI